MNITFLLILVLWLSFTFFFKNVFNIKTKGWQSYILWGLIICVLGMSELLFRVLVPGQFPHYLFLELPVYFLLPVLGYVLMSSGRRKTYHLHGYEYLQLVPALLCLLVLLPAYGLDGTPKQVLASNPTVVLSGIRWLLSVQLLAYLVVFIRRPGVFQKSKRQLHDRWWLTMSLGVFSVGYTLGLLFPNYEPLTEGVGLLSLVIAGWVYKRSVISLKGKNTPSGEPGIMEMLEATMTRDRLYLRKDLSLGELSEILGFSAHKVSRTLNHEAGVGYNDYINRYRVQEVIRLLEDQTHKQYTLEAISSMAGFRSLTTFNTAFKKQTGQTPKQFKI